MNTLLSCNIEGPDNNTIIECAQFTIDDTETPFILSELMTENVRYTFSFWIKSEGNFSIQTCKKTFISTPTWEKYSVVFTATGKDLIIEFLSAGTYYIYHPKLELGNTVTDWSPAPEDLDNSDSIDEVNDRLQSIYETYSDLSLKTNSIEGSVGDVNKVLDKVNGRVLSTEKDISDLKLTSSNLVLNFQNISDNGVSKVTTETGFTFDESGLTVDSTDTATKTTISSDGMTVYKTDVSVAEGEELPIMLTANSEGVDATNLHAKTYLIIGGRSRFENFGTNRTGCFWIGG